jgi:hypothetical protein
MRVIRMRLFISVLAMLLLAAAAFAQSKATPAAVPSPSGEDIPVLVKHLPNWESVASKATYVVTLEALKRVAPNQPILDSVSFEGGAEAVAANYGQAQLVIIEFATPQFSVDNDSNIWTKLAELKNQSQPLPTAYRRVGNYSVFVFNGADYASANELINQVQYQKTVQWLGGDPHLYRKLERYLTQTTTGVLIAVVESSGVSLVVCLALGASLGFLLFRRRRAQAAAVYSDAGGSVRLNLDELSDPNESTRLLNAPKQTN